MQNLEDTQADIVLLERIVVRDERAVGDLYDRHHRLLFGLILRILRDRSEAEEVLQEVFVPIWLDARRNLQRRARFAGGVARARVA